MRHQGYDSEDIDTWTLTPEDHALVPGKSRVNRLGFAVLLLFFRANGRFPEASEIHPSIVARVAEQLGTNNGPILDQAWHSRTGKRHRAEIRVLFGFSRADRGGRRRNGGVVARSRGSAWPRS